MVVIIKTSTAQSSKYLREKETVFGVNALEGVDQSGQGHASKTTKNSDIKQLSTSHW